MWIKSVQVKNWRGLAEAELTGLSSGLNVVAGPNESGKSRFVEALRFGLFESSKGQPAFKSRLRSWDAPSSRPQVIIEFDIRGEHWTVNKTFLQQAFNTTLIGPNVNLDGEDAEVRLRQMFGTDLGNAQRPAEGGQLGRWSLLWIDQGDSLNAPDVAGNAPVQGLLQEHLSGEVGLVAAGRTGQDVLRFADETWRRYYTAGGQESVAFRRLRDALAEAKGKREALEQRQQQLVADADRLTALQTDYDDLETRAGRTRTELGAAETKAQQLAEVAGKLELLAAQEQNLAAASETATGALQELEELQAQRDQFEQEREALAESTQAAIGAVRTADATMQELNEAVVQAEASLDACQTRTRQLLQAQQAQGAQRELEGKQRQLQQLTTLQEDIRAKGQALAALPAVTVARLEQLRTIENNLLEARARLQGAALRLSITAHQPLTLDGDRLDTAVTRDYHITAAQRIEVAGVLTLDVRPGGGELQGMQDDVIRLQREQRELLGELRLTDLASATSAHDDAKALRSRIEDLQAQLQDRFPMGREDLEGEIARLEGQLDQWRAIATDEDVPAALAEAEAAQERAASAAVTARARRDEQQQLAASNSLEAERLKERLANLDQQLAQLKQKLEAKPDLEAARQRLRDAQASQQEQADKVSKTREEYVSLGGDTVQADVQRLQQAMDGLKERLTNAHHDIIRLQESLRLAGNDDLHEALQKAEAEEAAAEEELRRTERAANTASLVREWVRKEYNEEREALLEPLRRAIERYLVRLFPNTRPQMDDFQIAGLQTQGAGYVELVDELSGGAREQVSLLTRLGLAEILAGEEGWPLVLDDVLVNTDPNRIKAMQPVLYEASRRHQILLFTCHGSLFDNVGADRWVELAGRRFVSS
ncbi:MAG: hypothetical protein JJU22_17080 [Gammaproteobacteria bacterium]|nr:hypothetical protein [Gammaproteobacteria bacterium]